VRHDSITEVGAGNASPPRKPTLPVCGKTGTGKTTSINTLFGGAVGAVGRYTRGTTRDTVYTWESDGEHIHVVDLPGLGDSEKWDKEFRKIYRRRVPGADAFIIVVIPPRPAEHGTLKAVELLMECGAPS